MGPICALTGLILRRCTLDEEGLAYWENPTYMKCISNDYRSIQTSVSNRDIYFGFTRLVSKHFKQFQDIELKAN